MIPQAAFFGCSTAGEVRGVQILDDTIQVCLVRFAHTRFAIASHPIQQGDRGHAAGQALAQDLAAEDLRGVLVLSDGLRVSGADLAQGLVSSLGEHIAITGGLAGDGTSLQRTWTLTDEHPKTGWVCALGLYGDRIHVASSARGGWQPFGPARRITRAHHNVLYELDAKPALPLYKEYLGELAAGLPGTGIRFPLELSVDLNRSGLVRTVIGVDEVEQSIIFTGDLYEGATARLMRASIERLLDGAQEAYDDLSSEQPGDALTIAISCVGRRLAMGQRTDEELEGIHSLSVDPSRQIGFYSYGELSPGSAGQGGCSLHNQTMTLTVLREV